MRLAKDGKGFDVDNIAEDTAADEVEVIQFLRPHGKRRRMLANVGEEAAKKAADMVLAAEDLTTGEVVVYARSIAEDEENEISEIATNWQGKHSPTECLKRLIEKKFKEREGVTND